MRTPSSTLKPPSRLVFLVGLAVAPILMSSCQTSIGPAITHQEYTSAGLGGPTVPTMWNCPVAPKVGQIFERIHGDDGAVSFDSTFEGIALDLATNKLTETNSAATYSYSLDAGPSVDVVLAYLGASVEGKAQYVRTVNILAKDTRIEYVPDPDRLINLINSGAYPTYTTKVAKDNAALLARRDKHPEDARFWIVTKVLSAKNFSFGVQRTRELDSTIDTGTGSTTTPSSSVTDVTTKVANALEHGALPNVKVTATLKDNDNGQISAQSAAYYPIFVQIKPLTADSDGDVSYDKESKNPPFEESQ